MYVCHTNQITSTINSQSNFLFKSKWYMTRFDPDTVQNGHIYCSIKEEGVSYIGFTSAFSVGQAEDFGYGRGEP